MYARNSCKKSLLFVFVFVLYPTLFADRGVILFGNATTNSAWQSLLANSPLQVQRGSIKIGDETFKGDDLGVYFTYPRADSRVASVSVIAGTGVLGMKAAVFCSR